LPAPEGTLAVFSWVRPNTVGDALGSSIDSIDPLRLPSALARYAFATSESVLFRPSWWKGLPEDKKKRIHDLLRDWTNFSTPPRTDLVDDGVAWTTHRLVRMTSDQT
jgi:hypothetical protein